MINLHESMGPGQNRTLDLINMPTNYHQNISKGIRVIKHTSFPQLNSFKRKNSFRLIAISPQKSCWPWDKNLCACIFRVNILPSKSASCILVSFAILSNSSNTCKQINEYYCYNHASSNLAIYYHETSQDKLPEA